LHHELRLHLPQLSALGYHLKESLANLLLCLLRRQELVDQLLLLLCRHKLLCWVLNYHVLLLESLLLHRLLILLHKSYLLTLGRLRNLDLLLDWDKHLSTVRLLHYLVLDLLRLLR
jgi:hypothetical protein